MTLTFFAFCLGYGWKLQQVVKAIRARKDKYDIVLFTDSFDSYIFSSLDEIVQKFRSMKHPMVVSGVISGKRKCMCTYIGGRFHDIPFHRLSFTHTRALSLPLFIYLSLSCLSPSFCLSHSQLQIYKF